MRRSLVACGVLAHAGWQRGAKGTVQRRPGRSSRESSGDAHVPQIKAAQAGSPLRPDRACWRHKRAPRSADNEECA
ncbi:hypothetical protein KL911_001435 [Ogataea haglerorum]|uniref:uncharacterized protein n=1 Tax=Ogataea haglerorum TaxID=1937702 RepID=UPI001C8A6698|nr:uncharacterized protein KL911_001435 [Ogataea haglerorum]KAG7756633.1 hypothetical protein KL911_001435 [Ogataea haglerorum]